MRKYGFKLFSTNLQNNPAFIDEAAAFVRANNREMFIELMVVPTTPAEDWDVFRDKFAGLEVTIHAPHNTMNFDTGYPERFESNAKILEPRGGPPICLTRKLSSFMPAAAGSGSIWKKRRGSFVCSAIRGL